MIINLLSNNTKKFCVLLIALFVSSYVHALSRNYTYNTIEELNNTVFDIIGGFVANPWNSENNMAAYRELGKAKDIYSDILNEQFSSSYYGLDMNRELITEIKKMKVITQVVHDFINPLAGYAGGGVDATAFEAILRPLLVKAGWSCKIVPVHCQDIVFYEFSYKEFKILLAHNTRPKASQQQEFQGKYHDNEVSCSAYSKNRSRRIYVDTVVRGGNYKTVFFKDDTQKSYERLFNATSKRLD